MNRTFFGTTALTLSFLLVGCATGRPIKLDPHYSERGIRSIALLPIIDRRKDRSVQIDLEYEVGTRAKRILEQKKYAVLKTELPAQTDFEDMSSDSSILASLGPDEVDAVMVLFVDDVLNEYKILSHVFKIEVTSIMVSKNDKTEIWRDKAIGNSGQAGLISGLMRGFDQMSAIDICTADLFGTLPRSQTLTAPRKSSMSTAPPSETTAQPIAEPQQESSHPPTEPAKEEAMEATVQTTTSNSAPQQGTPQQTTTTTSSE